MKFEKPPEVSLGRKVPRRKLRLGDVVWFSKIQLLMIKLRLEARVPS